MKSAQSGPKWSQQRVQEEVIATAFIAMKYMHTEPLLRIRVFFVDNFSAFRLDISDHYVVITKEDKQAAALRADAGTYFYDSYKDDVRLTERLSSELQHREKFEPSGPVSVEQLKDTAMHTGIADDDLLSQLDIEYILECVNNPKSTY